MIEVIAYIVTEEAEFLNSQNSTSLSTSASCINSEYSFVFGGMWWFSWLKHFATSLKVAGSIPSRIIGIFLLTYTFGHTMTTRVNPASNKNEYQG